MQEDLKKLSYHELLAVAGELGREEIALKLIEIQRNPLNAGVDLLKIEGSVSWVCRSLNIGAAEIRSRMN